MALSKAQWIDKLKSLMPSWVFERNSLNSAEISGIAAVMEQVQVDYEAHVGETFIDTSVDTFLDEHGDERSVERLSGESNSDYRVRVKSIVNEADIINIKDIVDSFLDVGEATIYEDYQGTAFCDREDFVDRGVVVLIYIKDAFIIIISNQSGGATPDAFFVPIVKAVSDAKAYGCLFRILELEA